MACRLFGAKPLPEPMLAYCRLDSWEQISVKSELEFYNCYSRNAFEIVVCQNVSHLSRGGWGWGGGVGWGWGGVGGGGGWGGGDKWTNTTIWYYNERAIQRFRISHSIFYMLNCFVDNMYSCFIGKTHGWFRCMCALVKCVLMHRWWLNGKTVHIDNVDEKGISIVYILLFM